LARRSSGAHNGDRRAGARWFASVPLARRSSGAHNGDRRAGARWFASVPVARRSSGARNGDRRSGARWFASVALARRSSARATVIALPVRVGSRACRWHADLRALTKVIAVPK